MVSKKILLISISALAVIVIVVVAFVLIIPQTPCPTTELTITEEEDVYIDEEQGSTWSIVVFDGVRIVASCETNKRITVRKYDLDLNEFGDYAVVASIDDTDGDHLADHKHIYQNGYHFLVFSISGTGSGGSLWLVKFDRYFNRVKIIQSVKNEDPTNDMLLFGDGTYVYVGKFYPEGQAAHKIIKYDEDLNWIANYTEGTGSNGHANGDAAIYQNGYFYFVSPQYLGPASNDRLYVVGYDLDFNVVKNRTVILQDPRKIGLINGLSVYNNQFIIHYMIGPNEANPIHRAVYDCNWNLIQNETVFEESSFHAPHSVIVNNTMYVGYTEEVPSFRGKIAKFSLVIKS